MIKNVITISYSPKLTFTELQYDMIIRKLMFEFECIYMNNETMVNQWYLLFI